VSMKLEERDTTAAKIETQYASISRIVAYGQDGDDEISVDKNLSIPAILYGQAGNDKLQGGSGSNFLDGGFGDDDLSGGDGRDILTGGFGKDTIKGGKGEDILIGGTYRDAERLTAVDAMMSEWNQTNANYSTRIARLRQGVGSASQFAFNADTIINDLVSDDLKGENDFDWFLGFPNDKLDSKKGEQVK